MNAPRIAAALAAVVTVATTAAVSAQAINTRTLRERADQEQEKRAAQQQALTGRQEKQFPTKAPWVAVSLNGQSFTGERPQFTLDDQFRVRGFAGCNTFTAVAYPLRQQRFAVGPFALTKKACDKGVMASELRFLEALRTSEQWDLSGRSLTIKTGRGDLRLERTI